MGKDQYGNTYGPFTPDPNGLASRAGRKLQEWWEALTDWGGNAQDAITPRPDPSPEPKTYPTDPIKALGEAGITVNSNVSAGDQVEWNKRDLSDQYNTPLTKKEKAQYQSWLQTMSAKLGRDVSKDVYNYDMRGFWKQTGGGTPNANAHFPDTFKKPNHPTFSNESIYANADNPGGSWTGEKYIPVQDESLGIPKGFNVNAVMQAIQLGRFPKTLDEVSTSEDHALLTYAEILRALKRGDTSYANEQMAMLKNETGLSFQDWQKRATLTATAQTQPTPSPASTGNATIERLQPIKTEGKALRELGVNPEDAPLTTGYF